MGRQFALQWTDWHRRAQARHLGAKPKKTVAPRAEGASTSLNVVPLHSPAWSPSLLSEGSLHPRCMQHRYPWTLASSEQMADAHRVTHCPGGQGVGGTSVVCGPGSTGASLPRVIE